jgi:transposase InsO family protein
MNISRSGFYKWLKNKDTLNRYEKDRLLLRKLIEEIHNRRPSYGYRRINSKILVETGWIVSNNLVHKICKALKIKSKAKHYKYRKTGEESIKYPNRIRGNWATERPFEKVVSDTTTFSFKHQLYDWTYYLDVFNNEIVGFDVRESKYRLKCFKS